MSVTHAASDLVVTDKDGDTPIVAGALQLWGTTFGSALGDWDESRVSGADITVGEASGQLQYGHTAAIAALQFSAKRNGSYTFDGNFDIECHYSGSLADGESAATTKTRGNWYLEPSSQPEASMAGNDNHVNWQRFCNDGTVRSLVNNGRLRAFKRTGGSTVEVGVPLTDNDDDAKLKITRTGDDFEWLRDVGGGFVSHGTATLASFPTSLCNILWFQSGEADQVNEAYHNWDEIIQNSGGVYWQNATGAWAEHDFGRLTDVDLATISLGESGTVELRYTDDEGVASEWTAPGSLTGTVRTRRITWEVRMNGGGETAAASISDLTYSARPVSTTSPLVAAGAI